MRAPIFIGDRDVTLVQPKDRDVAMVFQSYALYPHMTVAQNMGFPLKQQKVSKEERERQVMEAARILDLVEYLDRKPKQLSGGQRQRVAMGRAIVRHPAGLSHGRAALQPGRQAAGPDPLGAGRPAGTPGRHDRVRDARPGGGHDDGPPRGHPRLRRHAAGRRAEHAVPLPGQPLRGRLHRLAGDEPPAHVTRRRQRGLRVGAR